jgi:hypothetical protein
MGREQAKNTRYLRASEVLPDVTPSRALSHPDPLNGGALFALRRERETPMYIGVRPSALTDKDVAELKARHLACSHLIKGSQDAIIRLRDQTAGAPGRTDVSTAHRATEILEDVVGSWCETLSMLRSALNRTSSHHFLPSRTLAHNESVFEDESRLRSGKSPDAGRS